jgi:hypothetical protein
LKRWVPSAGRDFAMSKSPRFPESRPADGTHFFSRSLGREPLFALASPLGDPAHKPDAQVLKLRIDSQFLRRRRNTPQPKGQRSGVAAERHPGTRVVTVPRTPTECHLRSAASRKVKPRCGLDGGMDRYRVRCATLGLRSSTASRWTANDAASKLASEGAPDSASSIAQI